MLTIRGIEIEDTFAEAFPLACARVILTAEHPRLVQSAAAAATGNASSVIGCDAEAGVDRRLDPHDTPDGRVGAALMFFGFSADAVATAVANRTAQCLLTCPSTAVFDGLPAAEDRAPLGGHVRAFGDGYEKTKLIDGRRFWRIPVMDGEFLVEETS